MKVSNAQMVPGLKHCYWRALPCELLAELGFEPCAVDGLSQRILVLRGCPVEYSDLAALCSG